MVKENSNGSSVVFHINGEKCIVDPSSKITSKTRLVDYIRDVANLKGTKIMCREGGCGACTVSAKVIDPATGNEVIKSVNSCLTPVLSCDGWDISTVEKLGNKHEGYHVIQNRLVNFHGTQCGYCTPGMVMNMYSLLEGKKDLEMEDVEKTLDGNICRCTGYRPILDAFKSLAKDATPELRQKCVDIEDCIRCPMKKDLNEQAECKKFAKESEPNSLSLPSGEEWIIAKSLEGALSTASKGSGALRFVAGNTSTGIFKNEGPYQTFVDINGIPELKKAFRDENGITLGGGTTLTEAIHLLRKHSNEAGLEYGGRIATHLERVANVSVRNNGTLAGNLMIKHKHPEFPSDVFVILEAVGATLILASLKSKMFSGMSGKQCIEYLKPVRVADFLKTDMNLKIIKSIHLPKHAGCHFRSFKITRRYQNAHAYVNAALLIKVNKDAGYKVEGRPSLVYGGISASFIHASAAEKSLEGKSLTDEKTLEDAMEALEKEVKCEGGPLESSPTYRVQLVKSLLYKTIVEIIGEKATDKMKSGALDIQRNLNKGKQVFEEGASDVALYKNIPKIESGIQASGEAEYVGDIPYRPNELFGVFVTSTVACANLKEMDASEALKIPGVVRYITAKDIPGENHNMKHNFWPARSAEPVFVSDKVSYHGQSLGLILATSKEIAERAAKLVKVKYENEQKPVIKIKDAIEKAKAAGVLAQQTQGTFSTEPSDSVKVTHNVSGNLEFGSQYHFYMETQSVVCYPREDGIDVYTNTQDMDHCQNSIAVVLGIPTNGINIQVRRLGGGFGGKASRNTLISTACAVATWATNRPVRIILDMESNMKMLGKRLPYYMPYEVGFDDEGRIGKLKAQLICDAGWAANEPTVIVALIHLQNVYKAIGWEVSTHFVETNTPAHTFCRAPGSVQAVATIEWIMDHVANYLGKDPLQVREVNLLQNGDGLLFKGWMPGGPTTYDRENLIPTMMSQLKKEVDYEGRKAEIEKFNREHRWKKKGMSVIPVRYGIDYFATNYSTSVAIYHMDGHIAVCHGGIEMGQGLHTKVMQVVAQALGVPMDRIKLKPSNNFIGANVFVTAGSITSELVCYSVMKACEELRENLRPILEKLENPSWEKLIQEAHAAKVKLTASYTPTAKDVLKGYDVWVLNYAEVEIDVLTGEYKIARTDLYEDTGKSLSPGIDLGQIEGGYIFGQGYWTTEKIVYDEHSGELLTKGTWDYKAPEVKDLPEDFRITLLNNAPNPFGVLRSKATGEPSVDAAYAVVLALRNAIASARADAGNTDWFDIVGPVTPEDVSCLCLTSKSHLKL